MDENKWWLVLSRHPSETLPRVALSPQIGKSKPTYEKPTMLTKCKLGILYCGMAASLFLSGCSGSGDPDATPSPTTSATPVARETLEPNISPLGGKPATEEEKEYYRLQKKAEDLVLSRNYKEAIPLLEQAYEQQPKDVENVFYLLLSHGSLEVVPSKGSAAYPYAQQVIDLAPKTNEAERARAYLVGCELNIPKDFKYGKKTFALLGDFVFEPETPYKLVTDAPLHTEIGTRIGKEGKATLWEAEVAPEMIGGTITITKDTEVQLLAQQHYFYSLTSWRKPLPKQPKKWSDSIFEINAFYVEVLSDGDNKAKKGWLVNQVDRWVGHEGEDPFGVWIPDRLNLLREAEVTK